MINKSMRRNRAMRRRNFARKMARKTLCFIGSFMFACSICNTKDEQHEISQNEFIKVQIEEEVESMDYIKQLEDVVETEPEDEYIEPVEIYVEPIDEYIEETEEESIVEDIEIEPLDEETHNEEDGWYVMEQYEDHTVYGYKNPDNSLHANIDSNKDNDNKNSSFGNAREDVTTNRPTKSNVYYTEGGKSYHSRKSCPTLKRSNVKYGTCDKTDPCNVCCR